MSEHRRSYSSEQKVQIVLESMQRDTTIERVLQRYAVSSSVVNRWRKQFRQNAHLAFEASSRPRKKGGNPEESVENLQRIIGELTVENSILKKALSVWD